MVPKRFYQKNFIDDSDYTLESEDQTEIHQYFSKAIQNLDETAASLYLQKKSKLAQQIIPDFPGYPISFRFDATNKVKNPGKSFYANAIGQQCCIAFCETLFPGEKFCKCYPDWLRKPHNQQKMKLNGFCSNLMIAVEYYGIHHYDWPNFTDCTQKEFFQLKFRDKEKEKKCRERNICLIAVPYTIPIKQISAYIYAKLLDGVPGLVQLDNA